MPGGRAGAIARTLRAHLPEYASEALGLALFMVSASAFALLLEHPASAVHRALPDAFARRALMGLAMGGTLVANVHAPWGRRSGAHLNPATTLAFWRLGLVTRTDAIAYATAQAAGGTLGMAIMSALAGRALAAPGVRYVVTQPGPAGAGVAFAAELVIAFVLLSVVLRARASARHAALTPWLAGALLAAYITFEAPLSGTSMNPARTFASALLARDWRAFWVYLVAPTLAMTLAAEAYRAELAARRVRDAGCAKVLHAADEPCIFCGQPGVERAGTSMKWTAFTAGRRSA